MVNKLVELSSSSSGYGSSPSSACSGWGIYGMSYEPSADKGTGDDDPRRPRHHHHHLPPQRPMGPRFLVQTHHLWVAARLPDELGGLSGRGEMDVDENAVMKFLPQFWWFFTNRHAEWENVSPDVIADTESGMAGHYVIEREKLGWAEAWALIHPHPLWRFGKEMECGCERLPWRKVPFVILFDCEQHGMKSQLAE